MSNNMSNKGTSPAGGPGPDNRVLTPVVDVSGLRDVPVVVVPAAGVSWLPLPVGPVPVGPRYAPALPTSADGPLAGLGAGVAGRCSSG
jgi:hypothetical protein